MPLSTFQARIFRAATSDLGFTNFRHPNEFLAYVTELALESGENARMYPYMPATSADFEAPLRWISLDLSTQRRLSNLNRYEARGAASQEEQACL